jgi:hypothetical protein
LRGWGIKGGGGARGKNDPNIVCTYELRKIVLQMGEGKERYEGKYVFFTFLEYSPVVSADYDMLCVYSMIPRDIPRKAVQIYKTLLINRSRIL